MKILFGTTSQLKIQALNQAISFINSKKLYNTKNIVIETKETESGVPPTPYNDETLLGARNRIRSLTNESADLYIGLESGLIERDNTLFEECWCVIQDKGGKEYIGISSAIQLPDIVIKELKAKRKHTDILDELGERLNISSKDTWGVYTKGSLSRSICMVEACRNALVSYFTKF